MLGQVVAPKRAALAEANRKLDGANRKLATIRARVKELQERVAVLEGGLMKVSARARMHACLPQRAGMGAWLGHACCHGAGNGGQERGHGAS